MELNGIINIYKEAGYTSHDVVAKMRGICRQKKIGHTGTLDPAATGVLPVCLGSGTKLCDMLTDHDKEYVAELLLGVSTDTLDTTGEVLRRRPVEATEAQVMEAIYSFVGEYDQVPPMYSAIKVDGKKLYELAREGKEIDRKPRRVNIKDIEILSVDLPTVKIRVECSKGTYIRSLCEDIGEKLGCGGCMSSLVRTKVGFCTLEGAITLTELENYRDEDRLDEILYPVEKIFEHCPVLTIKEAFANLINNGNPFKTANTVEEVRYEPEQWVRVHRHDGRFMGIFTYDSKRKIYCPYKMFL